MVLTTPEKTEVFDVAICGGGLAGLSLARQLKLQQPELNIALIEKLARPLPEAAFKVGESTVEVGAYYLGETLRLRSYFDRYHLHKLGLRYFFGNSSEPLQNRPELGLSSFPSVDSYQIDRGILENDLRQMNCEAGVVMLEGVSVDKIILSADNHPHEIIYRDDKNGNTGNLKSHWAVDAMGRRRYIQKLLNLGKPGVAACSAAWFRLEGRIDISDLVPPVEKKWHARVPEKNRYYSTNHLMNDGYWVWLIPLSSGTTSIGIVTLEDIHPFTEYNTYEKALAWLEKNEPILFSYIDGCIPLDFRCMRKYSYSSTQVFSLDRWACVGEAGVFSDPYYSPGSDIIGFGNTITAEMIRLERRGELTGKIVEDYNWFILSLNEWLTHHIQLGYPFFGNPVVSAAKLIWDFTVTWSFYAPKMFNSIYLNRELNSRIKKVTSQFFFLTKKMYALFVEWGAHPSGRMKFEFIDYLSIPYLRELRDRNLQSCKNPEELVDDHVKNMELLEEVAQVLFLLAVEDMYPELLNKFENPVWLNVWGMSLNPGKWEEDKLFYPYSAKRDLNIIREQIRGLFKIFEITDTDEGALYA